MRTARITIWPALRNPIGRACTLDWERLFEQFSERIDFEGDNHAGWSPAHFDDDRRKLEGVREVDALVLDVDGGWDIESATEAMSGLYGLIHTSKSHTSETHRFRVVLPLLRPVTSQEYRDIWRRFDHWWPARFDPQAKDASRFWYLPGVKDESTPFEAIRLTGNLLDPDDVLSTPLPEPERTPAATAPALVADAQLERRAIAYLAKMPAAISGQKGHDATWAAACMLARGFGLSEERTLQILRVEYNPRCQPRWSDQELRHKAAHAASRSNREVGYLLKNDDFERTHDSHDHGPPPVWEDDSARLPGDDSDEEGQSLPAWERHGVLTMKSILQDVHQRCFLSRPAPSVSTGNADLDKIIGGYRPKKITIMGATTSWGKSTFAIMGLNFALQCNKRVLLVSAEDDSVTYGKRIMAQRADVSAMRLRDEVFTGKEGKADLTKMASVATNAEEIPWFIDGVGKPVEKLANMVYEVATEGEYELVIIDYIQAFQLARRTQDRRNDVTQIARLFIDAIKNAGAAGLILSQFKRLESPTKEPTKHDLKESGDLENMAEHIILGWVKDDARHLDVDGFPDDSPGISYDRVVKVAKNKDGPIPPGCIVLPFNQKTAAFRRSAPWPEMTH